MDASKDTMTATTSNQPLQEDSKLHLQTSDPDQILKILDEDSAILEGRLSPEEDRRLLRKIDLILLPVMLISYLLQYLDKSAMGYTSILGLRTDLHLVGQDYSWASSIFYFGYLAASYPVAYLLVRLPVAKFMAGAVGLWAVILMCMAGVKNASGLWAARFFLGFVEAAIAPGMTMIISMWYKRSEQPIRHAAWFMGNVLGGLFGGVLSYAIGHITVMAPWKVLFLVFGGVTVFWSLLLWFILPDTPLTARFISKKEQIQAIERVQDNLTGFKNTHWKRYQMIEALTDPKAWLLAIFQFTQNIPNGGVGNFASIVIQGLGFSTFNTLLVQMIGTAFQIVFVFMTMIGSTYLKNTRTLWMAFTTAVALAGICMIRQIQADHMWARFMGYCLIIAFSANFPLTMTMITSNVGGFTKKTTITAMVLVAYCAGNIIGPQVMLAREAPSYPSGFATMIACFAISIISILVLRFYLIRENEKRDRLGDVPTVIEVDGHQIPYSALNLIDKTDGELREFRYVY